MKNITALKVGLVVFALAAAACGPHDHPDNTKDAATAVDAGNNVVHDAGDAASSDAGISDSGQVEVACPSCIKDFFSDGCFNPTGACNTSVVGLSVTSTWPNGAKSTMELDGSTITSNYFNSSGTLCFQAVADKSCNDHVVLSKPDKTKLDICGGSGSDPSSVICPNGDTVSLSSSAENNCGEPPDCE